MPPRQDRDRRRPQRRRSSVAACAVAGAQAHPGEMSRQAPFVEPGRVIVGEPRRQDLRLPCGGRRFEAFELGQDRIERLRAGHPRFRRDALPGEQEAQEVARRHRLDLGAQALDGVMVDARQKPALAPFVVARICREAPAHGEAFRFEARERHRDFVRRSVPAATPVQPSRPAPEPSRRPRMISTSASSRDHSRVSCEKAADLRLDSRLRP